MNAFAIRNPIESAALGRMTLPSTHPEGSEDPVVKSRRRWFDRSAPQERSPSSAK
jgi:hypothetical protein